MHPITSSLLEWYKREARTLPWRGLTDPYAIWVSEVMLQQTQVQTVIPYFYRWMQRFPTLHALAEATEQDVLVVWEGLGYYSRARNLHRTAIILQQEHNGSLPSDLHELSKLPGIGKYTAAAITSIAFNQNVPAMDANILRILARLLDFAEPVRSTAAETHLLEFARSILPAGRAGDFNQALMDLGSAICLPGIPDCPNCPIQTQCGAFHAGTQAQRPLLPAKRAIPHITVVAAVLEREGSILLARRLSKGLLGGLWEFPGGKVEEGESFADALHREIREELGITIHIGAELGTYSHAYTHFKVRLYTYLCTITNGEPQAFHASALTWVQPRELSGFPMGKLDRLISHDLLLHFSNS